MKYQEDDIASMQEITREISAGNMIMLIDTEREREGDFVVAASMVTVAQVNFMIKHGSGIICLAMQRERIEQLGLQLISPCNTRGDSAPAMTVSIDACHGIESGVSAADRVNTIKTAITTCDPQRDLKVPGHMFPIMASEGGVLKRAGHTETSVAIVSGAGLYPAAVLCEVLNDDGDVANIDEMLALSKKYGIKIGLVKDVVEACKMQAI